MNPLILKGIPYAVIALLCIALGVTANAYLTERDSLVTEKANFSTFVERVDILGKEAQEKKKADDTLHQTTIIAIKDGYEKRSKDDRAQAVARYLAAHPTGGLLPGSNQDSGGNGMLPAGTGYPVDDGAVGQCLPDKRFIEECASDAGKLAAFQQYCTLNHCQIVE